MVMISRSQHEQVSEKVLSSILSATTIFGVEREQEKNDILEDGDDHLVFLPVKKKPMRYWVKER